LNQFARGLALAVVVLGLAACGEPAVQYRGSDISGVDFGRRLQLTDHNGRPLSLESLRGRLVVLFFGYMHCPDVCPTTLSDLAQALRLMPPEAAGRVQVLFVTVDPERDTPELLRQFVPHFHPAFLGLHGSPEEVAEAAREFRVVYRKQGEAGALGYLVDHSAGMYVLDAMGRPRLYLPYGHSPADIAHDLNLLAAAQE
jgi:protein SCO1/2